MNEDWKKKYYFDEKIRETPSSMPATMPANVSPFIMRDDYKKTIKKNTNDLKRNNGSDKRGCLIC